MIIEDLIVMLQKIKNIFSLIIAFIMALTWRGTPGGTGSKCPSGDNSGFRYSYGVFLGIDDDLSVCESFRTVVIDAQYFSAEEIRALKTEGHVVYSYINVGSLENFRGYYNKYKHLGLGVYEHWEDEIWIDVSSENWQRFIVEELAENLKSKGIDGFFADNCDVYYEYPTEDIFNGLKSIMEGLVNTGLDVIINSGNDFADEYAERGYDWENIFTGINQETVFSSILWNTGLFSTASEEDNEFFRNYIEKYGSQGADIYLLEYTHSKKLIKEIDTYCAENGFEYYISSSVELNG